MKKSPVTIGLLFLFFLTSFVLPAFAPAVLTVPAVSAASGGSSCPASDQATLVLAGGTPDSYASQATVSSHTGAIIGQMDFLGIYPWDVPLGTLYNQSLVDWVSHNANYTQWNVNIRPGLKWSNGSAVTSNDIAATYSSSFALNPTVDINNLRSFVTSVVKDNSSEVTFDLNVSNAQFLIEAGAALYTNVLPAAYANLNFTGEGINETVVGPYYPYNGQPGSTQLIMYRNPYFYTTGVPEPGPCALDITFVEATSNVENAMLSNSYDFGYVVDPGQVQALQGDSNLHIFDQPAAGITSIIWNATQFPFNYTQFRQAIAYAVDYKQIVSQAFLNYGSSAEGAQGEVPTVTTKYYDSGQQFYNTSASQAMTLLGQIGIKTVGSQLQWSNGQPVSVTLYIDSSYASDLTAASIVQQNLQALGMSVTTQTLSHTALSQYNHNMPPGAMFLSFGGGVDFPSAFIDATPGCSVFTHPHDCKYTTVNGSSYYIEVAQKAFNDAYNGNLTALTATADPTLLHTYLDNIQLLNAKYLPYLILGYPDELGVYSSQRWTGWAQGLTYPGGWFQAYAGRTNTQLWSDLSLVGSTTSATSSGTQSSTSATHTSSATSSNTMTSSSTTTTTTTTNNNTLYYAIAAIVVIVVVALGLMFARRGRGTPAT
jgi:ABC-type transport system substrate-binding protein